MCETRVYPEEEGLDIADTFGMVASGDYSEEISVSDNDEIRVLFRKRWKRLNFFDEEEKRTEDVLVNMVLSEPESFRTICSEKIVGGCFEIFHEGGETVLFRVKEVAFFSENTMKSVSLEDREKWNGAVCCVERGGKIGRCDTVLWHPPPFVVVPPLS